MVFLADLARSHTTTQAKKHNKKYTSTHTHTTHKYRSTNVEKYRSRLAFLCFSSDWVAESFLHLPGSGGKVTFEIQNTNQNVPICVFISRSWCKVETAIVTEEAKQLLGGKVTICSVVEGVRRIWLGYGYRPDTDWIWISA